MSSLCGRFYKLLLSFTEQCLIFKSWLTTEGRNLKLALSIEQHENWKEILKCLNEKVQAHHSSRKTKKTRRSLARPFMRQLLPSPLGGSTGPRWKFFVLIFDAQNFLKTKPDIFHPGPVMLPSRWWLPILQEKSRNKWQKFTQPSL